LFDQVREAAQELYAKRVASLDERLKPLESLTASNGMPIRIQISRAENKAFDFATIEQDTILEAVDHFWNQHLQTMDHLREGIGLRGYGQKNPLHEYQREGFELFQRMLDSTKEATVRKLFYYEVPDAKDLIAHIEQEQKRREALEQQMKAVHVSAEPEPAALATAVNSSSAAQDPDEQKAKLLAQKKARRKASR
jgi:preprotein translocase subunit SecA